MSRGEADVNVKCVNVTKMGVNIRLETKSCRILPLTYVTKYDST